MFNGGRARGDEAHISELGCLMRWNSLIAISSVCLDRPACSGGQTRQRSGTHHNQDGIFETLYGGRRPRTTTLASRSDGEISIDRPCWRRSDVIKMVGFSFEEVPLLDGIGNRSISAI
jgi:hypothetical protein